MHTKRDTHTAHMTHRTGERGFTLLFAVLISGILLAIGAAIFNITLKEVDLSASARESQFALYAADTGTECALYWDLQHDAFDTNDPDDSITCLNDSWSVAHESIAGGMRHTFDLSFTPARPYCATVVVTKRDGPPETTSIEARGYNTCTADTRRRVERALEVNY